MEKGEEGMQINLDTHSEYTDTLWTKNLFKMCTIAYTYMCPNSAQKDGSFMFTIYSLFHPLPMSH